MNISDLRGRHRDETCYIVGRGPSLLDLRLRDFGSGPVIAINYAILTLRGLGLPNSMYTMQKDRGIVQPEGSEILLVSAAESADAFIDWPARYVFDVEADFGRAWHTASAPVAVQIASLMGCSAVSMLGQDAYVSGDDRRVEPDGSLVDTKDGYANYGSLARDIANQLRLPIRWPPKVRYRRSEPKLF